MKFSIVQYDHLNKVITIRKQNRKRFLKYNEIFNSSI